MRHFKLDRFDHVQILQEPWEHEEKHFEKTTDHFRIADNKQQRVHLNLTIKAYNLMIDMYPKTLEVLLQNADNITYDYDAQVNHKFLGIAPFILANAQEIKVLEPQELRDEVMALATAALEHVRNSHMG